MRAFPPVKPEVEHFRLWGSLRDPFSAGETSAQLSPTFCQEWQLQNCTASNHRASRRPHKCSISGGKKQLQKQWPVTGRAKWFVPIWELVSILLLAPSNNAEHIFFPSCKNDGCIMWLRAVFYCSSCISYLAQHFVCKRWINIWHGIIPNAFHKSFQKFTFFPVQ